LENNGAAVDCIASIVHFSMKNLNMHSISLEPAVSIGQKLKNGGQMAFMEIILCLIMAGQ
jgi:hypothetical protein